MGSSDAPSGTHTTYFMAPMVFAPGGGPAAPGLAATKRGEMWPVRSGTTPSRFVTAVAIVVVCLTGPATFTPTPATAQATYPAKRYMDAYMGYWASQGHRAEAQLCLSALFATYYYAEHIWGPSVGVPSGAGLALFGVYFNGSVGGRCPGLGWDGGGTRTTTGSRAWASGA